MEHPEETPSELKQKAYPEEEEKIAIPFYDYQIPKQRKKKVKCDKRFKEEQSLKANPKPKNIEKEETTDTTNASLKPVEFD